MASAMWNNAKQAKGVIGFLALGGIVNWMTVGKRQLYDEVYGVDGNGGHMLKIVSDLTDEEIARLKFQRRMAWHASPDYDAEGGKNLISEQELNDRGIDWP